MAKRVAIGIQSFEKLEKATIFMWTKQILSENGGTAEMM